MSTPQRGLDAYRKEHLKADDPRMKEKYVDGRHEYVADQDGKWADDLCETHDFDAASV